ncbi:phage portal protein [Cereibacter azotoformans]|uniref:Phage portal protein n=1 Tax=Cereibacter azotoformans TaxID=43057 RepID=A0A2T5K788_9RHOB|nr:phage portal protein [Cereibacter azotoformans]PTR18287.1 phage portal protein [Cereibacter azotoformans]UIJ29996.1 phage portal protein [Cereibacter azotoformans]
MAITAARTASRSSSHGSAQEGSAQVQGTYLTDCLLHWAKQVEDQLALGVLTEAERRAGFYLKHDFGALLRPTTRERYEALAMAVGGPILTPNEARRIDGYDRIEGGDRLNPAPISRPRPRPSPPRRS